MRGSNKICLYHIGGALVEASMNGGLCGGFNNKIGMWNVVEIAGVSDVPMYKRDVLLCQRGRDSSLPRRLRLSKAKMLALGYKLLRCMATCEPTKPAPPVTIIFMSYLGLVCK